MDRPLIIKVRCEETLRRITAYVSKEGSLDLDLNQLRTKLRSLFEIPYDAGFKLRYIDEDGDEITLFENCDLCEAITQRLEPLRINLVLNKNYEEGSKTRPKSSPSLNEAGLDLGLGLGLGELVQSMSKVLISRQDHKTRRIGAHQHNSSLAGDFSRFLHRFFSSRFVFDLNNEDSTRVHPNTTFNKVVKLQNNGARAWPYKSKLVWIGGDQLADKVSVETEIGVDGLRVGEEVDVALKLKAPERVGCYTSCWMMCLPTGEAFGQRIWLTVQVIEDTCKR